MTSKVAFYKQLFLKCRAAKVPIGKKYAHQISSAIVPPDEVDPQLPTNIPVIGIIRQLKKKIP
jgi:hypothetical protein